MSHQESLHDVRLTCAIITQSCIKYSTIKYQYKYQYFACEYKYQYQYQVQQDCNNLIQM